MCGTRKRGHSVRACLVTKSLRVFHLFCTFGALSQLAAQRIIQRMVASGEIHGTSETRNALVGAAAPFDLGAMSEGTRALVMERGRSEIDPWKQPFALARFTQRICTTLAEVGAGDIALYCPHVFELPANYFFFEDARVVRRELLPDGLANYVPRPLMPEGSRKRAGFVGRVALRSIAARREGFRYRMLFRGDQTQWDSGDWDRTWTFRARGLLTRSAEVVELALGTPETPQGPVTPGILFLDQELEEIADSGLQARLRLAAIDVLRDAGEPVFCKPHPRGVIRDLKRSLGGLLEGNLLSGRAEQVVVDRGFRKVMGFYSTPLLLLDGGTIERTAILPSNRARGLRRPQWVAQVRDALRGAGVIVIEVD